MNKNDNATEYAKRCRAFEQQFDMTSDEFMQKFEAGAIGDDQVYFDWYAAKSGLDIWSKQHTSQNLGTKPIYSKTQRESTLCN